MHYGNLKVRGVNNNQDYAFQVTSHELEIPISNIHIRETTTDSVPNGPPTGASTGTDLNGMAVVVRVQCQGYV